MMIIAPVRYKNDPQIKAMTDLVDAYQRREVHTAEKILKGKYLVIHRQPHLQMDQTTERPLWMTILFGRTLVNCFAVCVPNT